MRSADLAARLSALSFGWLAVPLQAATMMPFSAAGDYSEAAVIRGVLATQAQCEAMQR